MFIARLTRLDFLLVWCLYPFKYLNNILLFFCLSEISIVFNYIIINIYATITLTECLHASENLRMTGKAGLKEAEKIK